MSEVFTDEGEKKSFIFHGVEGLILFAFSFVSFYVLYSDIFIGFRKQRHISCLVSIYKCAFIIP